MLPLIPIALFIGVIYAVLPKNKKRGRDLELENGLATIMFKDKMEAEGKTVILRSKK